MTTVIMLQGPFADKVLNIAPVYSAQGNADGWCKLISATQYPWPSSPQAKKAKPAASYDAWAASGYPAADPPIGAVVKLTKTNPSVLTLSASDFAKFATGNTIMLSGTTVPAINGKTYVLGAANGTNKTFDVTGLDLSGQGADLTAGAVVKV